MHKKVYIIGAGASKADGVPTMSEFISEGLQEWDRDDDPKALFELSKFIKEIFHADIYDYMALRDFDNNIGIEKVLESAINLNKHIAEKVIKKFIFKTIEKTSSYSYVVDSKNLNDIYIGGKKIEKYSYKFILNKIKKDLENQFNVKIISLNYDQLIETALLFNNLAHRFSYLIPQFETPSNRTNFEGYMKGYGGEVDFLKMHGSLNWEICNDCGHIQLYWKKRYIDIDISSCKEKKCKRQTLSPLLIAPSITKNYNSIFKLLLNRAESSLREANEIVIIGYSFREADSDIRSRFAKAICNNTNYPTLIVIDKETDRILNTIFKITGKDNKHFEKITSFLNFETFVEEK